MKECKVISVKKDELRHNERLYDVYTNKIHDHQRPYIFNKDVGCQYDVKRNIAILRRRDMYFSGLPKQVYAYNGTRSVTDIGVGSVKALQRKRVRRVYLPETEDRGIGSEDLPTFVTRRTKPVMRTGYYDQKKTSSKCVGGIIEYNTGCVMNEKLSPIVQTRSGATSPSEWRINTEVASNTTEKDMVTITTQVETEIDANILDNAKITNNTEVINVKPTVKNSHEPSCSKDRECVALENIQLKAKRTIQVDKVVSSDSLVQHVHNLENPSDYKQSHTSIDIIENKLEREYRKIFSTKGKDKRLNEKPIPDMKSASILRRRFEALRRGVIKKEDSTKHAVIINKESSQTGSPIRKDVSISSDPPSLEGRSYSNTKTYSPFHFNNDPEKSICTPSTSRKKSSTEKTEQHSLQWSQMGNDDSDCQGVKGMFKLWGKTFNLEEDNYKKRSTSISSDQRINTFRKQPEKKAELKLEKTVKKDGRKFFFFKKRSKEKPKPYKSKKGLTAGRCEVGDGLTIKIDGNVFTTDESKKKIHISEEILRKQWLHKYLSHAIESKNSVQIRWNNKTYATSSSTIFELIDTVYQDTGIVFRSKSEITTGESSFYRSRTHHVNFAHQEIEAWMIPKTFVDPIKQKSRKMKDIVSKNSTEERTSAQKWFIDKAKAFSRKIEVVLHTKHVVHMPKESSSEYLRIDIPKGFFIESSSDENRKLSSDEEVFKIVEYETESYSKRNKKDMATGDHPANDVKLMIQKGSQDFTPNILETVIKGPAARRDVVLQGSEVKILKRCDVIGVGIITQRDLRDIKKPILKIQDYLTDEESDPNIEETLKKCEFAESYLQDYYRHWTPLGMDFFSWCVSDSNVRCNSENSEDSYYHQGDGSKSCPNIYDDFQTSAIVSSNNACEPCCPGQILSDYEEIKPPDIEIFKCKWLKKFKVKKATCNDSVKRVLPKDSLEVFKRRKIYASSDKSKWTCSSYCDIKPYSVPSIEDKEAQGLMVETSKSTVASRGIETRQRPCKKHVSMKEDGTYEYVTKSETSPAGILMFRGASGCDVCKEAAGNCPKHATVDPVSCEIPDPPCRSVCLDDPSPHCSTMNQSSKKKQDLSSTLNECQYPSPEPKELITPPCLTADNLDVGPPCQECRSFMEESSPDPSSQERKSATNTKPLKDTNPSMDTNPSTETSPPTDTKLPMDTEPPMGRGPAVNLNSAKDTDPVANLNSLTDTGAPTKEASILCPHFPPCRKSQSSQKSVGSSQSLPGQYPKYSCYDNKAKKLPVCTGPPCVTKNKKKEKGIMEKEKSTKNTSAYKKSPTSKGSEQFPWPLKSQKSDQSLQDLAAISPNSKSASKSYKCNDYCPLSPDYSTQTLAPNEFNREVECKGECESRFDMKLSKAPTPSIRVTPSPSIPVAPSSSIPVAPPPSDPVVTSNPHAPSSSSLVAPSPPIPITPSSSIPVATHLSAPVTSSIPVAPSSSIPVAPPPSIPVATSNPHALSPSSLVPPSPPIPITPSSSSPHLTVPVTSSIADAPSPSVPVVSSSIPVAQSPSIQVAPSASDAPYPSVLVPPSLPVPITPSSSAPVAPPLSAPVTSSIADAPSTSIPVAPSSTIPVAPPPSVRVASSNPHAPSPSIAVAPSPHIPITPSSIPVAPPLPVQVTSSVAGAPSPSFPNALSFIPFVFSPSVHVAPSAPDAPSLAAPVTSSIADAPSTSIPVAPSSSIPVAPPLPVQVTSSIADAPSPSFPDAPSFIPFVFSPSIQVAPSAPNAPSPSTPVLPSPPTPVAPRSSIPVALSSSIADASSPSISVAASIPATPANCCPPCPLNDRQSPLVLLVNPPKNNAIPSSRSNLKPQPLNTMTYSKECSAAENNEDKEGVIRLNSKETITIRMKELTPSTEEIREAMNIKVKDDDGNTLYERIDYRKSCNPCRSSLLGNMYKAPEVNRCSTPIIIKNVQTSQDSENVEDVDNKSDSSIANLVEIKLKLKITQGDKITELNIGKNKNNNHMEHIKNSEIIPTPQDVFVVKDDDDNLSEKPSPKNDVNIRIVIKNFKLKPDKKEKKSKYDDDFSQNISNKFHTVSTGYSDVYTGQKLDNVFSVQRATIDLTTSNEILKPQAEPSETKSRIELRKEVSKMIVSSNKAKLNPSPSKHGTDNFDNKSIVVHKKNDETEEGFQSYLPDQEVRPSLYADSEHQDSFDITTSFADSDMFVEKPKNKDEKKELLKIVMEKAHDRNNKTKHKMKNLRDMLRVVLTSDSSGHDEMAVTSNELLKDLTFASLRPDFLNETDSMHTSYNIGSILSLSGENEAKYYPTQEQNSECSRSEERPVRIDAKQGCMCSTFAERLNMCGLAEEKCCCRGKQMINEETNCDINTENNILFMNVKTAKLVDVETQPSKYSSSRVASASYSIRSGTNSNMIKNKQDVPPYTPKNIVASCKDTRKETNIKTLNRNIAFNLSDEDRAVLLKATPTNVSTEVNNVKGKPKFGRKTHILQSYATKKAVLEIYAQKTIEEDGEHIVAKLPKFVYDKESEISKYEQKRYHYNGEWKRNVVMSVER